MMFAAIAPSMINAYAGNGFCDDSPLPVPSISPSEIDETLRPGESIDIEKTISPNSNECFFAEELTDVFFQCDDASLANLELGVGWNNLDPTRADETVGARENAEPGDYHCDVEFVLKYSEDFNSFASVSISVFQLVWITVPEPETEIHVHVDIKPESCPNPINTNSKGLLPVAILGNEVDVEDIDASTIQIAGVSPIRDNIEDVATPHTPDTAVGDPFDCSTEGPDGIDDLTLKFDMQEIVVALGLDNEPRGTVVVLVLTGNLLDGTPLEGYNLALVR